jgi:hypothetical protein
MFTDFGTETTPVLHIRGHFAQDNAKFAKDGFILLQWIEKYIKNSLEKCGSSRGGSRGRPFQSDFSIIFVPDHNFFFEEVCWA